MTKTLRCTHSSCWQSGNTDTTQPCHFSLARRLYQDPEAKTSPVHTPLSPQSLSSSNNKNITSSRGRNGASGETRGKVAWSCWDSCCTRNENFHLWTWKEILFVKLTFSIWARLMVKLAVVKEQVSWPLRNYAILGNYINKQVIELNGFKNRAHKAEETESIITGDYCIIPKLHFSLF